MVRNIEFSEADWDTLIEEALPLFEEHYLEVSRYHDIPLNPDHTMYLSIQEKGLLRVYIAREAGELIGYSVFFLKHNLHYKDSFQAVQDIIFIRKDRRGFGSGFIAWCDDQLRKEKVQVVYHHVKAKKELNFGPLLERQGYELIDLIYGKRLD